MERIGPYKIIGEIGRGGMGIVLHGVDPAIGRPVAIKVILLQEFSDPKDRETMRARLFREARAAGILSHPGIVTVYYMGQEGENTFIAMEYVNGPTLEKVLSAPEAPERELLRRVLLQTAAALDYAHSRGIVHRDIKPANIMLDETGAVKICDFGIATGLVGQSSITETGASVGSPSYMSPEQIQGGDLDYRTDQYSSAVVAYQALTGERPFQSERIQSLFFRIMNSPPPQAHQANPALCPGVSEILAKALAKDPSARYANCAEFVRALLEKWDMDAAPPAPTGFEDRLRRKTGAAPTAVCASSIRPRLWIAGLAAAAGLAVLWIAAFYWARMTTHERTASLFPPPAQPLPTVLRQPLAGTGDPARLPEETPSPAIESFKADPPAVPRGSPAILRWSVKHATEIRIGPGIGVVAAFGSRSVTPQAPTTYKLAARAANGPMKTASVTIEVLAPPTVENFSTSRVSMLSGQAAVLRWRVSGAARISINPGVGNVSLEGDRAVFPTEPTRYILQAAGPGGSVNQSVEVNVTYKGEPNIVRFWADPDTIDAGQTAVLRWEVVNAAEVKIEPGVGRVDAQGRFEVSPQSTKKYRIYATSTGTFHRDVEVKVEKD
jgi:tRNA A-37 threonylcarbamoyl transferase component Bud32